MKLVAAGDQFRTRILDELSTWTDDDKRLLLLVLRSASVDASPRVAMVASLALIGFGECGFEGSEE